MANAFSTDIDIVASQFLGMPVITLLAEEGNLDRSNRRIGQSGAKDITHGFVAEIEKGNLVVAFADLTVANRANTDTTVLGVAHATSEPLEGLELTQLLGADGTGITPDQLNQVPVEIFGIFARTVQLGAVATSVAVGDGVLYHVTAGQENNYNQGTAGNGTYVLTAAAQGEEFLCVFNHQGVLT